MVFCCHLCKRLGAEAEGSVHRRSHSTHPHQVVPLEHFCVGRNSCWTVALTPTLNDPRLGPGCTSTAPCLPRGRTCCRRDLAPRAKTTADTCLGGSRDSDLLKNAPIVAVCVCVCSIVRKVFIRTSFNLAKNKFTCWEWDVSLLFSKGALLDCSHR